MRRDGIPHNITVCNIIFLANNQSPEQSGLFLCRHTARSATHGGFYCVRLHRYPPLPFPSLLRAVQRPSGDRAQLPDICMISANRLFAAQKPQNARNKTPYQRHAETVKRCRNARERSKTLYRADSRQKTRRRRGDTAPPGPDTATNVEPRDISMDTSDTTPTSGSPPAARKSPKSLIVAKSIVAG